MAGLIKKQILKHLSRFAKNLSPDKINLSTLKGEGQLTNLELDEEVLQNMLDLPTWLAINRVGCNKAAIRIPWTKLKTHPITLSLDKVEMEMSTCDEPRPPNGPSPIATASGQSEYGFAEKVVEGISLSINSIVIRISAKAFNASFELSQLQVYSVNTSWIPSDLRFTRIQDPTRGEILTFKEVSWQMIRIEADAIQSGGHETLSAPIRLITNQSKIRVTLKRRMKDCNVVASKLILILDDLLWVLTDSQLKAMVQYAKSLSEAMEKSAQQRKSMASESSQGASAPPSAQPTRAQQSATSADQNANMAKLFSAYDVCETSHHLQITHLDLHICDDIHSRDRVMNKRITGGAMQLSFSSITLDYYPFHRAGENCLHWMHYSEATKSREGWARSLLEEFRSSVDMLRSAVKDHQSISAQSQSSPTHGKISTSSSTTFSPPSSPRAQLISSSFVLRMADFSIYQVSTADQRRSSPKTMISCNKKSLYLPQEMPAIHAELTEYYYPDGKDSPIPCPNLYVQLNALQLVLDPRSLVWLNLFALDLKQSLEQFMELYKLDDSQKPDEHVDIRVDGLMLKLVIPAEPAQEGAAHADLPRSISVQMSEMVATNTRHSPGCSRSSLESLLSAFQEEAFFSFPSTTSFPRDKDSFPVLHAVFQRHAYEQDTHLHDVYRGLVPASLTADALKMPAASDLWALHFSQFWVDYEGMSSGRGRPIPFVDSFPLTLWMCQPARHLQHRHRVTGGVSTTLQRSESADATAAARLQRKKLLKEYYSTEASLGNAPNNGLHKPCSLDSLGSLGPSPSSSSSSVPSSGEHPDVQILVHVQKHLSVQMTHLQYVFLLRLQHCMKELQLTLQQDLQQPAGDRSTQRTSTSHRTEPFSACVGILVKSAEVALLLKPVPDGTAPTSSPMGSDLSPSDSHGTIEAGREGGAHPENPPGPLVERTGAEMCPVDQLLCMGSLDGTGHTLDHAPLLPPPPPSKPTSSTGRKVSIDERSSSEEKKDTGQGTPELERDLGDSKNRPGDFAVVHTDPLTDPLSREGSETKDRSGGNRLPQSMSRKGSLSVVSDLLSSTNSRSTSLYSISNIGRLMRDRSQTNFAVSFKNMKKSPSLQSLDNISIDSYLLEDCDAYSLLERDDVSLSGFKDGLSEQSATESASEVLVPYADGAMSPDAVSAASQSIDEPTKDLVSVLVLKVHSVCGSLDIRGENTAVALDVGQVRPSQLGNVSLRQYLSNRSLGFICSSAVPTVEDCQGSGPVVNSGTGASGPEVKVRLESGPSAAAHSPLSEHNGFLQCRLHALSADFLMSTLRNLGHFLEDDSASQVLPMEINIRDIHVNLKDDGPRDSASDPDPTPMALHIDSLLIHRRDDGSFNIGHQKEETVSPKPAMLIDSKLNKLSSVPELPVGRPCEQKSTQTLPVSPTTSAPSVREKMLVEENECLKQELSRAKMALAEAHMEKDSLLHHMKNLKLSSGSGNS
ncbi:bridge-like lipid transfer protein family member 3B isoform X2 [Denticeps clupeoides]|uniref:bridge-like lipid transfer protein family member 3B isoform X2 n=1 Tax=Denticeps clupeoides TaxID=299321 RepID=UPI0010A3BB15|nr:UHRF1-binding protein 1-like isoform X2 [Denticeps clupeoides]